MKRLIALLLLIASPLLADEYAIVFIDNRIDGEDLTLTLVNIKEVGTDANIIDESAMPVWIKKSDTAITGKVVSIRTDSMGVNGWKDMPLSQIETRITKDVKPPSKQWVRVLSMDELKADYKPSVQEQ